MQMSTYKIKVQEQQVELWSTKRLPFEPTGWLAEMKNELRSALKSLTKNTERQTLTCSLRSLDNSFFDPENVLLYNVGSGAFSHLARHALQLKRTFEAPPPCPVPLVSSALYYHKYALTHSADTLPDWAVNPNASWRFTIPRTKGETKPHHIWWAMKNGITQQQSPAIGPNTPYGLVVHYQAPKSVNLTGKIKVLLDGIVSGLHSMSAPLDAHVADWLAKSLNTSTTAICRALEDSTADALGDRALIHRFGKGVQWNPQDELCHRVVLRSHVVAGAEAACWGEVYYVS
jgi:hypothetical protein